MVQADFAAEERLIEARWRESLRPAAGSPWFNAAHVYRIQEQERAILRVLRSNGYTELKNTRVLDIGCGPGGWLHRMMLWGARPENLAGIDLVAERVEIGRQLLPSTVALAIGNAARLDYADATFDVVIMSLVLSLILDPELRRHIALETLRVMKPGGIVIWYDYRYKPPKLKLHPMRLDEIRQLFTGCEVQLRSLTPIPPVRRLARYSWMLCELISKVAPLRTHYIGAIRKRPETRTEGR
ncbi:MAG: class I SAM-dependent methyltransferase [Candidatus Binataceae bacterium]